MSAACAARLFFQIPPITSLIVGIPRELNHDDGNGNARKQQSDWLNEEK